MAISYEWQFPRCDVAPSLDGLQDVVTGVHWRLVATDGAYVADCYGSIGLAPPNATSFTAFSALSKEQVTAWVIEQINARKPPVNKMKEDKFDTRPVVEQLMAGLESQIAAQKAPVESPQSFAFGG